MKEIDTSDNIKSLSYFATWSWDAPEFAVPI